MFRSEIFAVDNFDLNHFLLRKTVDYGLPTDVNYAEIEIGQEGESSFRRSELVSERRKSYAEMYHHPTL